MPVLRSWTNPMFQIPKVLRLRPPSQPKERMVSSSLIMSKFPRMRYPLLIWKGILPAPKSLRWTQLLRPLLRTELKRLLGMLFKVMVGLFTLFHTLLVSISANKPFSARTHRNCEQGYREWSWWKACRWCPSKSSRITKSGSRSQCGDSSISIKQFSFSSSTCHLSPNCTQHKLKNYFRTLPRVNVFLVFGVEPFLRPPSFIASPPLTVRCIFSRHSQSTTITSFYLLALVCVLCSYICTL